MYVFFLFFKGEQKSDQSDELNTVSLKEILLCVGVPNFPWLYVVCENNFLVKKNLTTTWGKLTSFR